MSKLNDFIDDMQEKAEELECSGDKELFQILDTGSHYLREMSNLLEQAIPDVDNGIMQHYSQELLSKIKNMLDIR